MTRGQTKSDSGRAIAVMPLRTLADDLELSYLAEGIAEDLSILLARLPGFFVISQSSTLRLSASDLSLRAKGEQLGVQYIVEGTVRPIGDRLRLSFHLVELPSGKDLYAEQMDRDREDALNMPDELARAVVARLEPELAQAELAALHRRVPTDLGAWDLFRRAQGLVSLQGWHEDTFAEAAELLRESVERDPEFAEGHSFLALILAMGRLVGLSLDPDAALEEAEQAASKALALDNRNSVVLGFAGCAFVDLGSIERGLAAVRRATETDPSNAQAWAALGTTYMRMGKLQEGAKHLKHGLRISPLDARRAVWRTLLASGLLHAGRYNEAIEQATIASQDDANLFWPWLVLAAALTLNGSPDAAKDAFARALEVRPEINESQTRVLVGAEGHSALAKAGLLSMIYSEHDTSIEHQTADSAFPELTARELEVLDRIAQGLSNQQIAEKLFISPKTVRNHITHILSKLELTRRAEAIVRARDAGLGRKAPE